MKILETDRDPRDAVVAALTADSSGPDPKISGAVAEIIRDVKERGDQALLELGRRFDSPHLSNIAVSAEEASQALETVDTGLIAAIRQAKANIEAFHRNQVRRSWLDIHEDWTYGQIVRPIESVGVYAPCSQAPLPSTVLMTAVPALVAGVERIVLCSPATADGTMHPAIIAAARECGIREMYKIGGAQAAAALAFGTATVRRLDKVVGPGNAYFTEAKRQLYGIVGIDHLAGPSEILVIADDTADASYVAADMLSQAEHAPDSRCALVTDSRRLADACIKEIKAQCAAAGRKDVIAASLDANGVVVIAGSIDECIELANIFAPEHLELAVADPWGVLKRIKNAGAVMMGHYTPVPLCDFAAGPNHTLPTGGTARFGSPLGVDDFVKRTGLLEYSKQALARLAPTVTAIAGVEGLDAHANTVRIRIKD